MLLAKVHQHIAWSRLSSSSEQVKRPVARALVRTTRPSMASSAGVPG